eukprot:TRINITY_DN6170_c0_g1_i1.p2 TRINITY_DN6170_c0_g1~~TRINITY_DN6170_c0_g1_i1.p2  ORF type:complete len:161 (+),score=35.81 TRINITY_DN6170_c0_g1_i1:222-704(+)
MSLEDAIRSTANDRSKAAEFNNLAQVWNHSFFWQCMSPNGGSTAPSEELVERINLHFDSVDNFKKEFSNNATALFGSGWTWLVDRNGHLEIMNTSNAGSPLGADCVPLLTLDVWEHSYYLDHQNRRPEYIEKWWSAVNWDWVSDRSKAAQDPKKYGLWPW